MTTQVMHTAVRCGLVDALAGGPGEADELARRLDGDAATVLRLLRALVVLDLATVDGDERFSATPLLAALGTGAPGSLRDTALYLGGPAYRAWGELTATVVAGEHAFERAMGAPFWEYLAANPAEGGAFNGAMRGMSLPVAAALVDVLEIRSSAVVDVGGGQGHLAAALLEASPQARGIVFDQPQLEPEASALIAARGLSDRCRFVGGSFFEAVPSGDLHLLKWILHDWADADCSRILDACRAAIAPAGRLVVVERPLPELAELAPASGPAVMADLMMLAVFGPGGARERTRAQYAELLAASGFALREHLPLAGGFVAFIASPS